jgi:hypothetical protein
MAALGSAAEPDSAIHARLLAARADLSKARTLEKFSLVERANAVALEQALAWVDDAQRELTAVHAPPGQAADNSAAMKVELLSLRRELEQLHARARQSFFGRFPLIPAFGARKAQESDPLAIPVCFDGMARRAAIRAALNQAAQGMPLDPVTVAVAVAGEGLDGRQVEALNALLAGEAPLAFGPVAAVQLVPAAICNQLPGAPGWDDPDAAFIPYCRQLLARLGPGRSSTNLAIILVREVGAGATENHWVQVQRRLFYSAALAPLLANPPATTLESAQTRAYDGLARDRSQFVPALICITLALAILSLLYYAAATWLGGRVITSWQAWLLPPMVGFALGFLLPPMIVSVLHSIVPEPLSPAAGAAWWPCLAGALILFVPAIVFALGTRRIGEAVGGLRCDGRWGTAMVCVALGVGAAWARPTFLGLGWNATNVLLPLISASMLLVYIFGRAFDAADRLPLPFAGLAVAMALPLGYAEFLASPRSLWSIAGLITIVTAVIAVVDRRQERTQSKAATPSARDPAAAPGHTPCTLAELRLQAEDPSYYPTQLLVQARSALGPLLAGKTLWLSLHGPSGAGKTALARRLIADLCEEQRSTEVFAGRCQPEASPYQPLRESLSKLWQAVAPAELHAQTGRLDSVLQELVGIFVPFWGMLASFRAADGAAAVTQTDLFAAVAAALRKQALKRRVILFLDDVQWLDDASAALLKHLHERLPADGSLPLLVLLSGREQLELRGPGGELTELPVAVLSPGDQIGMLRDSLGIEEASARHIVEALGSLVAEPGGLFWLGRCVVELTCANAFQVLQPGFALRSEYLAGDKTPLPTDLRNELSRRLRESHREHLIVACAALLGEEFRINDLAEALAIDRLELLQILGRLEHEPRILRDLPAKDQYFAFCSTFMFQVVRQEFGIDSRETRQANPGKLVQELHSRIAKMLQARGQESPAEIFALARHYHDAGSSYSAQTYSCGLKAARAAVDQAAFDDARRYLEWARTAASQPTDLAAVDRAALIVDCEQAHVSGRNRLDAAQRACGYVQRQPVDDADLLLAAARAAYDAGRDTGDPAWFERSARLAQQIVDRGQSDLEKAAGYHLLGVSLPPNEPEQRLAAIRRALALVDQPIHDKPTLLLRARVLATLAEQLSDGPLADRESARALFERSLELRGTRQLGDLPGQARAHGGLGRLAYFSQPPDYERARRHFLADLEIATEIGDQAGVSLCHSFLAGCDRTAGQLSSALSHYRQALDAADGLKDRCFATIGLLEVSLDAGLAEDAARYGSELAALASHDPFPEDCADRVVRLLGEGNGKLSGRWLESLADRFGARNANAPS